MAQQALDSLKEQTIVDTDIHLTIDPNALSSYIDNRHKQRVKNGFAPSTWDPTLGGKIETRELADIDQIQNSLVEDFHIDYPLLNTIPRIARISDSELAVAMMRAYNDLIIDKFLDTTDYFGLGVIAPQDPEATAEEIDRLASESQIVGVFVEAYAQDPPLGDSIYDVMYQAAEDNDLQIAYHGAAATGFKYEFPVQDQGLSEFLEVHTLSHLWEATLTITSLFANGVPEKFPGLNFSFLESGLSWVPHMMWKLNREYTTRRSEAPLLSKSPEEYIRDQFYFASQPLGEPNNPQHIQEVIDIIGAESIMFASDYPHWDFDHPTELDKHLHAHFNPEEREQILYKTPNKAFGLGL